MVRMTAGSGSRRTATASPRRLRTPSPAIDPQGCQGAKIWQRAGRRRVVGVRAMDLSAGAGSRLPRAVTACAAVAVVALFYAAKVGLFKGLHYTFALLVRADVARLAARPRAAARKRLRQPRAGSQLLHHPGLRPALAALGRSHCAQQGGRRGLALFVAGARVAAAPDRRRARNRAPPFARHGALPRAVRAGDALPSLEELPGAAHVGTGACPQRVREPESPEECAASGGGFGAAAGGGCCCPRPCSAQRWRCDRESGG